MKRRVIVKKGSMDWHLFKYFGKGDGYSWAEIKGILCVRNDLCE